MLGLEIKTPVAFCDLSYPRFAAIYMRGRLGREPSRAPALKASQSFLVMTAFQGILMFLDINKLRLYVQ